MHEYKCPKLLPYNAVLEETDKTIFSENTLKI